MVSSEMKNSFSIRVIHKALQSFSLLNKAEKKKYLFFSFFSAIMQGMDTELRVIVAQKNPSNLAELSSYADQAETVRRIQQKKQGGKEGPARRTFA